MALDDVMAGLDEWIAGNDHAEFYWHPYTDRAQLKLNNRVPANDRPLSRIRSWIDDEFISKTMFGLVCRLGRAMPPSVAPISAVYARALTTRTYSERSYRGFCTPRRVHFTV